MYNMDHVDQYIIKKINKEKATAYISLQIYNK